MGYVFENNGKTIWSPSRDVAQVFLSQVRYLEDRLKTESGLLEIMSDTINVDFDKLFTFLQHIASSANLDNTSMRLLLKGVIVHTIALLFCGSVSARLVEIQYPIDWVEESRTLCLRAMEQDSTKRNLG